MKQKYCLVCGKQNPFGRRKYCSDQCRKKVQKRQTNESYWKNKLNKQCVICGKPLNYHKSMYCSEQCMKKGKNKLDRTRKYRKQNNLCLICGNKIKLKWNYRYCSAKCLEQGIRIRHIRNYEEKLRKQNYSKLMEQLALRSANVEQPFLSHFDSVVGVSDKKCISHCILDQNTVKQLGIQPILDGSMLYWQPKTKALYLHVEDKYYALTAEF